jgi:hypothetical protein
MTRYLPEGISFDEGQHMLRSAGFDVSARPAADVPGDRVDRYDVTAVMGLQQSFLGKTELMLGMRPKSPGDYSTVKEIWAVIFQTYL